MISRYGMDETRLRVAEIRRVVPQGHIQDPASSPTVDSPGRWVDMLSDREAKQLLLVRLSHYRCSGFGCLRSLWLDV